MFLAVTLFSLLLAGRVAGDEPPGAATNALPVIPADQAPPPKAPAKAAKKKKPAVQKTVEKKKPAAPGKQPDESGVSVGPAVVSQNNVNVRGQAAIDSEVVVRLKKGDHVNVLEAVTLKHPKTDEPARWARIALPPSATVWVHSGFIDPNAKTVVPKKLKLRSGPGENYSVLGIIPKGTAVKEIESKGDWIKIEAPADASAFVAAHLLSKEPEVPAAIVAANRPPPPPVPATETAITPPATPAVANDNPPPAPVLAPPPKVAVEPPPVRPEPPVVVPPPVTQEETLVKRTVTREGIVRRTVSIQAPTYFVLGNLGNGKAINYLHSSGDKVALKDYLDKRIVVTGEELLDERWPNTPVIDVETIQAVP